jgi:hypothetical protein
MREQVCFGVAQFGQIVTDFQCEVRQPQRFAVRIWSITTNALQSDIVMVTGDREKDHAGVDTRDLTQAEHISIKRHRSFQASYFEHDVPEAMNKHKDNLRIRRAANVDASPDTIAARYAVVQTEVAFYAL